MMQFYFKHFLVYKMEREFISKKVKYSHIILRNTYLIWYRLIKTQSWCQRSPRKLDNFFFITINNLVVNSFFVILSQEQCPKNSFEKINQNNSTQSSI